MASGLVYVIIIVLLAVVFVFLALNSSLILGRLPGKTLLAVQMTDPPNVPPGTQHLFVAYSGVAVRTSGGNASGWITAQGSGTVDLMQLQGNTTTIANAAVSTNSTINLVRFNITSATIVINGSTYNVNTPNNKLNIAITGNQKINSSSSAAVLVDVSPTVNAHGGAKANATYTMAPAARAIIINPIQALRSM